jgi:hypothetical protein
MWTYGLPEQLAASPYVHIDGGGYWWVTFGA